MLSYLLVTLLVVLGPTEKRAVFTPDATVIDYGTIEQGADRKRELYFTNTGTAPLVIVNVNSSCGCLVPYWSKDPVLPGKRDKLGVTYDTNRPGPFTKTITVHTNEPEPDNIHVIKITGNVTVPQTAPGETPKQ